MTSTIERPSPVRRRPGFTLIELLVVIGILVLLAGILLPAYTRVVREAKRAATGSKLRAIDTAIQAYHDDFKVYPPLATYDAAAANAGQVIPQTGFAALANCLLGPGGLVPAGTTGNALSGNYDATKTYVPGSQVKGSDNNYYLAFKESTGLDPTTDTTLTKWRAWNPYDGLDGFGFKIRRQYTTPGTPGTGDVVSGKTYGPYLGPEFAVAAYALLDGQNNPIGYYVASGHKINAQVGTTPTQMPYVAAPNGTTAGSTYSDTFYNALDSGLVPLADMQKLMGVSAASGILNSATETPATTGPYLLWSAGPDGIYGFDKSGRCDDVANFDLVR